MSCPRLGFRLSISSWENKESPPQPLFKPQFPVWTQKHPEFRCWVDKNRSFLLISIAPFSFFLPYAMQYIVYDGSFWFFLSMVGWRREKERIIARSVWRWTETDCEWVGELREHDWMESVESFPRTAFCPSLVFSLSLSLFTVLDRPQMRGRERKRGTKPPIAENRRILTDKKRGSIFTCSGQNTI